MKRLTKRNLQRERNGSGVYKIYDSRKRLVYVGRSSNDNIKHHLVQHFGSGHYSGAKFGSRKDNFYDITLLPKPIVKDAERFLIKKLGPKGNRYIYELGQSKRRKNR